MVGVFSLNLRSQKTGPQCLLMIAKTCSDWSKSMARQGWEGCFSHNTWQLLISNTTRRTHPLKNATKSKARHPRGALSVPHRAVSLQMGNWFFEVATQCSCSNKVVLSSQFQQMFYGIKEKKSLFFSVFRWWTSLCVC